MGRTTKRLLNVLAELPWWSVLLMGIAGYVILSLTSTATKHAELRAVSEAIGSFAIFWFAFGLGAAFFGMVHAAIGRVGRFREAERRSDARHWTGDSR